MIADEATLSRLAALAQQGDKQAYATLLEESRQWLGRYFRRRVLPHDLDDLVQDTLLSLHRKLASYEPERAFMPWLAVIARYRFVDHLRLIYRRAEDQGVDFDIPVESEEESIAARISLDRMFEGLPTAQSRAIELVRIEGLSISEASLTTGQSESLVKVNIHRGLKRLADLIERA